jgi:phosphatidylserine/phosphatidylglycerophosphate/cardiolipin synthase-like enzyme
LFDAQKRGVKLRTLFDKSDERDTYGLAAVIARAGIPARTDFRPAIAHNKIVVADRDSKPVVVTGSFNFTRSAQDRNAENVLVILGQMDLAQNLPLETWAYGQGYVSGIILAPEAACSNNGQAVV